MTPTLPNLHYFHPSWIEETNELIEVDACLYGGTAAGVIAAVELAERGISTVLLNPARHLGGMSTAGLGWTDFGRKNVIGGKAAKVYEDIGTYYGKDNAEWHFEPKAAQAVFDGYASKAGLDVRHRQFLDQVFMEGRRITEITLLGGLRVRARFFLDTTYEGDLMAKAGVSYTVGRESNAVYGETINGVQIRQTHQFSHPVDPYVIPGDPSSGTLPWINQQDTSPQGSGDHRIQAYNFRMCMTDDPKLRVDWVQPESFRDIDYELARRWFNGEKDGYNDMLPNYPERPEDLLKKFDAMTPRTADGYYKTDTNNHGPFSSDFIGANYAWPEADYAQRERLFQAHVDYQMGLYWFMANDSSVPSRYRDIHARFGLPKDEFTDTGHWPHQLYVREARRMLSDYVLTEADTQHLRQASDPVAMGSYAMDSHNCQRFVRDGRVYNEGDVQKAPKGPYAISYRSCVPRQGECNNLFVSCCISASHIAYGSVRMEPVFMAIAQSAAIAVHLCLQQNQTAQELEYDCLQDALQPAGQVLNVS